MFLVRLSNNRRRGKFGNRRRWNWDISFSPWVFNKVDFLKLGWLKNPFYCVDVSVSHFTRFIIGWLFLIYFLLVFTSNVLGSAMNNIRRFFITHLYGNYTLQTVLNYTTLQLLQPVWDGDRLKIMLHSLYHPCYGNQEVCTVLTIQTTYHTYSYIRKLLYELICLITYFHVLIKTYQFCEII